MRPLVSLHVTEAVASSFLEVTMVPRGDDGPTGSLKQSAQIFITSLSWRFDVSFSENVG